MIKKKITLTILIIIAIFSSSILIEQVIKKEQKYDIKKTQYKFFIKNPETLEYEPYNDTTFPGEGYYLNVEMTNEKCTNSKISQADDLSINVLVNFSTSCNLYYDLKPNYIPSIEILQSHNPNIIVNETTPDFTKTATTDEGVFEGTDDYGTTYYWRGASTTNYIKFGDLYWQIVRINGDDSARLILIGSTTSTYEYITGQFNNASSSNKYLKYVYDTNTSSNIKTSLENWYEAIFKNTKYEEYISDTEFCYDSTNYSNDYGAYYRASIAKIDPILTCPQKADIYTVSDTDKGNGLLSYPIGLLNLDEARFAGMVWGSSNTNNKIYLYRGVSYWLGSPGRYYDGAALGLIMNASKYFSVSNVTNTNKIIPVINITNEALTHISSGTGSKTDPFIIDLNNEPTNSSSQTSTQVLNKLKSKNANIELHYNSPSFRLLATTDEGIFAIADDYGTSYYWRGASTTNYIKFGDWYWRIVRINGDGSLRLIYAGTSATAKSSIGTSTFNANNDHNAYVGYMYGDTTNYDSYNKIHANTNSSAIKTFLDNWYINNISGKNYETYISDTEFCYDRSIISGDNNGNGVGVTTTYYASITRNRNNREPSIQCSQKNDRFTVDDTTNGNGALTYPIGLLNLDEAAIAGMLYGSSNSNNTNFLHKGLSYWTGTPFDLIGSIADNGYIGSEGYFDSGVVTNTTNVVPVINLKPSILDNMTGTGTSTDPFIVN